MRFLWRVRQVQLRTRSSESSYTTWLMTQKGHQWDVLYSNFLAACSNTAHASTREGLCYQFQSGSVSACFKYQCSQLPQHSPSFLAALLLTSQGQTSCIKCKYRLVHCIIIILPLQGHHLAGIQPTLHPAPIQNLPLHSRYSMHCGTVQYALYIVCSICCI